MIETICRLVKKNTLPFGGLQVILVGDFFQLPPVISRQIDTEYQDDLFDENAARFAYDSTVWQSAEFVTCYLDEQYRQDDVALSTILTKIRANNFDDHSLEIIRQRKFTISEVPSSAPKLYSHNIDVDQVNDAMLAKIDREVMRFEMLTSGKRNLVETLKKGCLSPENLLLKVGAAVMFTKNNTKEGFVNGTLGEVVGFDDDTDLPIIKTKNNRKIRVSPADWTVEENGSVRARLTQVPLRLAWAITVHKSQGISLDSAIIDLSKVFEYGQGYVAISRVRKLAGLHILGWNSRSFQVNPEVLEKDKEFRIESANAQKIFARFSDTELDKMYEDFIRKCDGEIKISQVKNKNEGPRTSTLDKTLELWNDGKDISEIATKRKLAETTIFSHIEELVKNGKIAKSELTRIIPTQFSADLPIIKTAFTKLQTEKLSPIYDHFHGRYSYDELRLARILL